MAGDGVEVDATDWNRKALELRAFEPKLLTALRREIRDAALWGADKVKDNLAQPSPDTGPDTGDVRSILSRATKVSISTSARSADVKIITSGRGLPAEHRGMEKVYNTANFRHPVYGNDNAWVGQRGRPYFVESFEDAAVNETRERILAAWDAATAQLERS